MAFNSDLNLNTPTVEEHSRRDLEAAFNNGMIATRERYRGLLFVYQNRLEQIIARHDEEREVYHILGKLELLKELFNLAAMTKEKKLLENELVLAKEKMERIKIPEVDWIRLGEPQMSD
ncbi:Uncharacterized protein Rs2_21653 [Raphanus sativus]|nr:Uncharacterized protein Rs2_21653 [Raphanus sativus]